MEFKDSMPSDYDEKLELLEKILETGLQKLLNEARRTDILKFPYGRSSNPTPLITEEEFVKSGAWKSDHLNDDEPKFEYNYGFNPIRFMGDFIKWAHPDTVAARRDAKSDAFERLKSIARHGVKQIDTVDNLKETIQYLRSGILWGPFTTPLSSTSVLCICQPLKAGTIVIQVTSDDLFRSIPYEVEHYHSPFHTAITDEYPIDFIPAKVTISNLDPGKKYFIRCYIRNETPQSQQQSSKDESNDLITEELNANFFRSGGFWTLPSEDFLPTARNPSSSSPSSPTHGTGRTEEDGSHHTPHGHGAFFPPITIFGMGIDNKVNNSNISYEFPKYLSDNISLSDIDHCFLNCILGDPLTPPNPNAYCNPNLRTVLHRPHNTYRSQIFDFYRKSPLLSSSTSITRHSSLVLGWNDSRQGSDADLRKEETQYKQFAHEMKKYEKKYPPPRKGKQAAGAGDRPLPPIFDRPLPSRSFHGFSEGFPVLAVEDATVHMYRSFMLGQDVQVFVLDVRNGYLGKHQAKWVRDGIERSEALWKVVLYGTPFGVRVVESSRKVSSTVLPVPGDVLLTAEEKEKEGALNGEGGGVEETKDRDGVKGVSMVIPNASEHDEVDEQGRPRSSLQYVIANLQKNAEKLMKNIGDDNSSVDDNSETSLALPALSSAPTPLTVPSTPDQPQLNKTKDSSRALLGETVNIFEANLDESTFSTVSSRPSADIFLDSGILLLTGGTADPFVATYDPRKWGKPFACEVNVGSALFPSVSVVGLAPLSTLEQCAYMKPMFLYAADKSLCNDETDDIDGEEEEGGLRGFDNGVFNGSSWCELNLLPDGKMSVSVMGSRDVQEYEAVCRFKTVFSTALPVHVDNEADE